MRKVDPIEVEPDEKMRSALILGAKPKDSEIMLKDAHLLEAARAAEMRIVSKDVDCRRCFRIAAKRVVAIREICWVDPTAATERPVEWLHRGAPLDRHRLLGSDGG
jgi:hypothetical protein